MNTRLRIALVLLTTLVAVSCSKQEQAPPPAAEPTFVDEVNDLAAVTDPVSQTLFVLENEKEAILKRLGATASGEKHSMMATNLRGNKIPWTFQVRTATTNQLFLQTMNNLALKTKLLNLWDNFADRDTARGTFLGKLDTAGVCYRVYRNARCVVVEPARDVPCEEELLWDTIRPNPIHTGRYWAGHIYTISHCLKGTEYCVEALKVRYETRLYNNPGCTGAPLQTVVRDYDYNCAD